MNCSFCKRDIEPGTGSIFVSRDGKTKRFCSNKCRKNESLGRDPQNLKWVTKDKKSKVKVSEE